MSALNILVDGALISTSLVACTYCVLLSRRVRRLASADQGVGKGIADMVKAVERLNTSLEQTRMAAKGEAEALEREVKAARELTARTADLLAEGDNQVNELARGLSEANEIVRALEELTDTADRRSVRRKRPTRAAKARRVPVEDDEEAFEDEEAFLIEEQDEPEPEPVRRGERKMRPAAKKPAAKNPASKNPAARSAEVRNPDSRVSAGRHTKPFIVDDDEVEDDEEETVRFIDDDDDDLPVLLLDAAALDQTEEDEDPLPDVVPLDRRASAGRGRTMNGRED